MQIADVLYGDNGDMVCGECAVQDEQGEVCQTVEKRNHFLKWPEMDFV